jgi:hypothetical protein
LLLTLRLDGWVRGAMETPWGRLERDDNWDGEIRGEIGQATWFLALRNMEDDIRASSSYDGGWVPRPRRHAMAGVRWSFWN